jgi:hypothetical protein
MRWSHQHESEYADVGAYITDIEFESIHGLSYSNGCGGARAYDRCCAFSAACSVGAAG